MSSSTVTIRPATPGDIPSIQKIARITWADTYHGIISEDVQGKILGRAYSKEALGVSIARNQAFLVAEVDGQVAGYTDVDFDGQNMNLHRLYILPEYQRLGLGQRLLEESVARMLRIMLRVVRDVGRLAAAVVLEDEAARNAQGPDLTEPIFLVAHVERDNPNARAFYKKMGFSEVAEETVTIGGAMLPVIRISKLVGKKPAWGTDEGASSKTRHLR